MKGLAILAAVFLIGGAPWAGAEELTYTESTTATGTLGTTAFSNALITISLTANTSDITTSGTTDFFPDILPTITIAGVGTATFTSSSNLFTNSSSSSFGFDFLYLVNNSVSYNLETPLIQVTGTPVLASSLGGPPESITTRAGALHITSVPNSDSTAGTFSATAAPEPSTIGLFSAGVLGLLALSRRKVRG